MSCFCQQVVACPPLATQFNDAFAQFNKKHESSVVLKEYILQALDNYIQTLSEEAHSLSRSSFFSGDAEKNKDLHNAIKLFRQVLEGNENIESLNPYHNTLVKSQFGMHYKMVRESLLDEKYTP